MAKDDSDRIVDPEATQFDVTPFRACGDRASTPSWKLSALLRPVGRHSEREFRFTGN